MQQTFKTIHRSIGRLITARGETIIGRLAWASAMATRWLVRRSSFKPHEEERASSLPQWICGRASTHGAGRNSWVKSGIYFRRSGASGAGRYPSAKVLVLQKP